MGSLFYDNFVAARSTDSTRAFMSCALTLAGMWPTKGTELDWNPELNWSPIPIKSEPLNEDTVSELENIPFVIVFIELNLYYLSVAFSEEKL